MSKIKDMTGKRVGRLVVIEKAESDKRGKARWLCQCDCGNTVVVNGDSLRNNRTNSCGCLKNDLSSMRNKTHGMYNTKLYRVYRAMLNRCNRPKDNSYKNYGEREITVCNEWLSNFQTFYDWAISNGYKDGLTLERKDVNKGYSPDNCCWIPKSDQSRNRRSNHPITYKGETKLLVDWSKEYGISIKLLSRRLRDGWDIERALNEPPYVGKNQHYKENKEK